MSDEKTFKLDILASDRSFYSGPCEMLIFPALDGLQGVLPHHEATVTCTSEGELKYKVLCRCKQRDSRNHADVCNLARGYRRKTRRN